VILILASDTFGVSSAILGAVVPGYNCLVKDNAFFTVGNIAGTIVSSVAITALTAGAGGALVATGIGLRIAAREALSIAASAARRVVVSGFEKVGIRFGEKAAAEGAVESAAPSAFTRTESLSGRASSQKVSEIANSMRADGWQGEPIKVVEQQGDRIVVDGHHRLAAAQRAGLEVPFKVVDPATVIRPGSWSSVDDILRDATTVAPNRLR